MIIGCGDVGHRLVTLLLHQGVQPGDIHALSRSKSSVEDLAKLGVNTAAFDLDSIVIDSLVTDGKHCFYFVAPQKEGVQDLRSAALIESLERQKVKSGSLVVISTTGVYGDTAGEWVTESSITDPQTDRGKRRLQMEQQWTEWCENNDVPLRILRVPGIYAHSRLPVDRLRRGTPVVKAQECGFSNRIHADDLAQICLAAQRYTGKERVFNATDGTPGKISEYLQAASDVLDLPQLPEITMAEAQRVLSPAMLSYLSESRKISNKKMLQELKVALRYPDFRIGLRH